MNLSTIKQTGKVSAYALAAVGMLALSACSSEDNLTNNANTNDFTPSEQTLTNLADSTISEFLAFAKTPRPGKPDKESHNLDKARDYLVNWAKKHNFTVSYDSQSNVWIDVPANNESMASFPTVILQGHMDMVCSSKSGETYDYTQVVGEPYYDGDLLKGRKVNLGADDGVGVGMALAIASSNIAHGPLRLLITANEDTDMEGAINLDPSVLNTDYLINIDEEEIGKVSSGCLGSYTVNFEDDLSAKTTTDITRKSVIDFTLTGLPGGHSGVKIGEHILSATTVTSEIIKNVITPASGNISYINCGKYDNAIADATTMQFVVDEARAEDCVSQIKKIITDYQKEYTDVTLTYNVTKDGSLGSNKMISEGYNATLNKLFEQVKQGVIERDSINVPTKSNNIGVVSIMDGKVFIRSMFRSYFTEWLESEKTRLLTVRTELGMTGNSGDNMYYVPAWSVASDNKFRDKFLEYYKENYPKAFTERAYGGLECGYFVQKRSTLNAISVGPQVDNAHTIDEAVHVSTIKPLATTIVKMLQNIDAFK